MACGRRSGDVVAPTENPPLRGLLDGAHVRRTIRACMARIPCGEPKSRVLRCTPPGPKRVPAVSSYLDILLGSQRSQTCWILDDREAGEKQRDLEPVAAGGSRVSSASAPHSVSLA